jgi:hypothetical protein
MDLLDTTGILTVGIGRRSYALHRFNQATMFPSISMKEIAQRVLYYRLAQFDGWCDG